MNEEEARDLLRRAFRPGELFEERYRVDRVIGEGAFAYVIKAHDTREDRPVAVKVLRPDLVEARADVIDRFDRECHFLQNLRHPNTVNVYGAGVTEESLYFLVMEYVSGMQLDAALTKHGRLAAPHAVKVIRQVLGALEEAHGHQVVHRDMKPENVMVCSVDGEKGVAKVLDFGIAKVIVEGRASQIGEQAQRSTQFIGTPIYMSPEQALGERVSPQTDVYAVGIMLYELLSGDSPPLHADSVGQLVRTHLSEDPLPFEHFHDVPLALQTVIRKATERHPADRYPTARAFSEELLERYAQMQRHDSGARTPAEVRESLRSMDDDVFGGGAAFDADSGFEEEWTPVSSPPRRSRAPAREAPAIEVEPSLAVDIRPEPAADASRRAENVGRSVAAGERNRQLAWTAAGIAGLFLSFVVASATFATGSGPVRLIVGLLPAVAAGLWTQFSSTRRSYGGILGRWLEPLSRHMLIVTAVLVVFLLIAMPGRAANRLNDDAAWFVSDGALHQVVDALGGALASLFSFAYRALPW